MNVRGYIYVYSFMTVALTRYEHLHKLCRALGTLQLNDTAQWHSLSRPYKRKYPAAIACNEADPRTPFRPQRNSNTPTPPSLQ